MFTADCGLGIISLLTNVQHTKFVIDLGICLPLLRRVTGSGQRQGRESPPGGLGLHEVAPLPPQVTSPPTVPTVPPAPVYSVTGHLVVGQLTSPAPSAEACPRPNVNHRVKNAFIFLPEIPVLDISVVKSVF